MLLNSGEDVNQGDKVGSKTTKIIFLKFVDRLKKLIYIALFTFLVFVDASSSCCLVWTRKCCQTVIRRRCKCQRDRYCKLVILYSVVTATLLTIGGYME